MQRARFLPVALIAAAAAVAGCGGSKSSSTATIPTSAGTSAQGTSSPGAGSSTPKAIPAALITTKHDKLGTILAFGPRKLTLYLFEADHGPASSCSGTCAKVWPPVTGRPEARDGAAASDLGTTTGAGGAPQVTYKGHPLYLYIKDKDGGDTYGEGIKSFGAGWYALKPSGDKVDKS